MHWTSNIFGPAATTIAGFGVLQNYPILNFKETLCQKKRLDAALAKDANQAELYKKLE